MARRILALLLLGMAGAQLSDVAGFVDIIETYEIGGRSIAWALALLLVAGELAGGIGLLGRSLRRRVPAATVAVGVAVLWSALAAQAFARGLVLGNCGCFGVDLAQELRWWILLEDLEFLVLAVWVARRHGARPAEESEMTGIPVRA